MTSRAVKSAKKILRNKHMIYIEWDDSMGVGGSPWVEPCDISDDTLCMSVGFIIKENAASITLAGHKASSGQCSGPLTIPKSSIRKRRVVHLKP